MRSFQTKGETLYFALSDSYMYFVQAINARTQMNHTNKHSLKTTFINLASVMRKGTFGHVQKCRPRPAAASPTQRLIRICTF